MREKVIRERPGPAIPRGSGPSLPATFANAWRFFTTMVAIAGYLNIPAGASLLPAVNNVLVTEFCGSTPKTSTPQLAPERQALRAPSRPS